MHKIMCAQNHILPGSLSMSNTIRKTIDKCQLKIPLITNFVYFNMAQEWTVTLQYTHQYGFAFFHY